MEQISTQLHPLCPGTNHHNQSLPYMVLYLHLECNSVRGFLLNCSLESSKQDITRIPVPFTEPNSARSQQKENFPHSTLPLPHTTFIAFSIASNHSSTAKLPPQGQVAMGLQNNSTSCDTNLISSTYGIDLTPLLLFSFSKLQVALNDVIHEVSIYCGHSLYLLTRWVLGNKLFISQQYSSGENIFHWKKLFFKSSLQYQPNMAKELHEGLYAVVQCTTVIHFVRR